MRDSIPGKPLVSFHVLVEYSCGVSECTVGMFQTPDAYALWLLAEQVVSGRREKLSEEQLIEAIELSQWSFEHPEVFAGQTSPET